MDEGVKKPNFFKNKASERKEKKQGNRHRTADSGSMHRTADSAASAQKEKSFTLNQISPGARESRKTLQHCLEQYKLKSLLTELDKLDHDFERKFFTVAVVGEFSRGKSTLLNRMFDGEFLPVGNLPTTAVLTKIRYNKEDMLAVFDQKGRRLSCTPLKQASWDGLTADMEGKDPDRIAMVGLKDDWLAGTGIELEDMPGAGDLYGNRASLVDEALLSDDGAIIVLSATQPLSSSEQLFIQQRLLSKKVPFLMVVISKLDQVRVNERPAIVEYIKNKLTMFDTDIPVYLPYEVEMPDDSYADVMGMDKIRQQMESWKYSPERRKRTENAYLARLAEITNTALDAMEQQKQILAADADKRAQIIATKKSRIEDEAVIWGDLRIQMMERSDNCKQELDKLVTDGTERMKERIQLQVSHSGDLRKWMKTDYPYYLKSELMNLMSQIDNSVSRTILTDARWLNEELGRRYKVQIGVERQVIADKDQVRDIRPDEDIKLDNLSLQRNVTRVATTAATIVGYAALASVGILPIVATMGIGTGASIASESFFKKKLEDQRQQVSQEIAGETSKIREQILDESRPKITAMYENIIEEEKKREQTWIMAQNEAIENSVKTEDKGAKERLAQAIGELETLQKRFSLEQRTKLSEIGNPRFP